MRSRETWNPAFQGWYGKEVPDLAVTDIDGRQHRLSAYRGKDVLVVFWATWCPACNQEIPHLIELRKVLGEEQLVILAISNETAELLKHFAAARGINYAVATPGSGALPVPFSEVASIPTTFFIDRSGNVKFVAEGLISLEEAKAILRAES
ncbi:MAG: TlpA disulfide reductase family protein [Planctomycetota bacterium]